jgi:hypothetical protein
MAATLPGGMAEGVLPAAAAFMIAPISSFDRVF